MKRIHAILNGIALIASLLSSTASPASAAAKSSRPTKSSRRSSVHRKSLPATHAAVRAATPASRPPARIATGKLAAFAQGVTSFQDKQFAAAVTSLSQVKNQLPPITDYVHFYLAAAQDASGDPRGALQTLGDLHEFRELKSPLFAKAVILTAKNGMHSGAVNAEVLKGAVETLRDQSGVLPQPEGDFALALTYDALGDGPQAATYYQRVYFMSPATEMAAASAGALERLKQSLGGSYPPALPQLMLMRGQRWIDAKEYGKARAEFQTIEPQLGGLERDQARVRVGAAELASGDARTAYGYLKSFDLPRNEADAERLYLIEECAHRMNNDGEMMEAVKELEHHHERSVWRLKALVSAGNRYLMTHEPDKYEPLYRAAWVTFPSDNATAYCHWKITWDAYMANRSDARDLMLAQVEQYPGDNHTATAMYFLGREAERQNDFESARAYYDRLNAEFPNFYYAVLARGRLNDPRLAAATPASKVTAWLANVEFPSHADYSSQTPSEATKERMERVHLLASAGMPDFADAEVRFGAKLDGQPHLLALELAKTDPAIHDSLRHMKVLAPDYLVTPVGQAPKLFWQMLFPLPYAGPLVANARKQNLDPFMVAALIRQESEFNPTAHSYANAYGLTQIVPATGRMLAKHQGMRSFSTNLLYQPETNLLLGTTYLRELLDQWNGKWEETLASYNAGASRVKQWLAWGTYREPAEFVESIPITQTREYVQSVMRNAAVYREVYGDRVPAAGPAIQSVVAVDYDPVLTKAKLAPTPPARTIKATVHVSGKSKQRVAAKRKRPQQG